jgi:hypothetical protein
MRLQAHEKVELALKKLVLSNPNLVARILIEPQHLRQDKSRPGDIVAMGMGSFLKDTAMECVIISGLAKSCLSNQAKSSDCSLRLAKKAKFVKDKKFSRSISSSAVMRLIPLAMNHLGLRGPHFQTILKEFATSVVTNPAGCSLLQGPFAISHKGAL